MSTERWAIDANIIVQPSTVRLIAGSVEATQAELLVPERALELATAKHFAIARRRASRVIEHELNPEHYTAAHLRETTITCTVAIRDAFATWAGTETYRNDGLWTLAPDCEQAKRITASLFAAGIARASSHLGIEEDAQAVGQALAAQCRWIASHNLTILSDDLVPWLAHEQAHGRLTQAANPFICSVDTALHTMLKGDYEALAAIAWELTRPDSTTDAKDLTARRNHATRFVRALRDGGAVHTAEHLAAMIHSRANPEALHERLSDHGYAGKLDRTRSSFQRFATSTRTAQSTVIDAAQRTWTDLKDLGVDRHDASSS